jgi:hypothetical protein
MPRSERCRIRGNCLDRIPLPSLAQAPVARAAERLPLVERLASAAHRAGGSRRTALSPSGDRATARSAGLGDRPAVEALRTVARAWAELEDPGPGPAAPPGGWDRPAGCGQNPIARYGGLGRIVSAHRTAGTNGLSRLPRRPCKVGVRAGLDIVAAPRRHVTSSASDAIWSLRRLLVEA